MAKDINWRWSPDRLQKLSNAEFIDLFRQGIEDRTSLDFKAFVYKNKKKHGAPPEAIDHLLAEAQRRQIPLSQIAELFARQAFSQSSFVSNLCAPSNWRKYEIHAAAAIIRLLESEGMKLDSIEYDAKVIGQVTQSERQVDLLLKKESPKRHYVAGEIKNYERDRVAVEKVEAFVTKMKDIGVDHGVMISPNGFQQSAIATATNNKITLFTLREVVGVDVPKELKAVGPIDEKKIYWVLERGDQKWLFEGQLTIDK